MLTAFAAVSVAGAAAAEAHAVLLSTSPAAGAAAPEEPQEVVLTFNEAISGLGAVVRVTAPSGQVSTGSPRIIDHTAHQALLPGAGGGSYRVDWRVTSSDGHPVSSTFTFTVDGPPATKALGARPASPADAPVDGAHPSWRLWAAAAVLALLATGLLIRVRAGQKP